MLTFLPLDRIQHLEGDMQQSGYKPNTAQRLLAEEVIRFVHGEEGLSAALSATQVQRTLTLCQLCQLLLPRFSLYEAFFDLDHVIVTVSSTYPKCLRKHSLPGWFDTCQPVQSSAAATHN